MIGQPPTAHAASFVDLALPAEGAGGHLANSRYDAPIALEVEV
jgi:hypothetical protein